MTWTNLSVGGGDVRGVPPAPRGGLGLAFTHGVLYVFGGWSDSGKTFFKSSNMLMSTHARRIQQFVGHGLQCRVCST